MKLIMIHGKSQVDREENELRQEWIDTLNRGLAKTGKVLPDNVKIEFPYYAKILDGLIKEYKTNPKPNKILTRSGSNGNKVTEEETFLKNYLIDVVVALDLTQDERFEFKKNIELKRDVNNSILHYLLGLLERKSVLGQYILQYIDEVHPYLTVNSIKKAINEFVMKSFDNEPCVVVGHSLGTIVSYLVLKNNPQYNVRAFITIGSPLGLKIIKDNLEPPLIMPTCIKGGWFNAYDKRDIISLYPLDRTYFNIRPLIENRNDIDNKTNLPDNFPHHGIKGYLEDEAIANRIFEALS